MTLIMGFNLSDRVYLSGDSRLSSYGKDGVIRTRHDNMQKVEILPGTKHITVASAGDAKFAQHILAELAKTDFIKDGIVAIRENIETWVLPLVDGYFTANDYTNVTFIFGGTDSTSKKVINCAHWKAMANMVTGGKGMIYVNSAVQAILTPGKPVSDADVQINGNNAMLFSVAISQAEGVRITDTKWGEFLMFGQGSTLVKEDIGLKEMAELELKPPLKQDRGQDGNAMALLNGIILSSAAKYGLTGVGGCVFTVQNNMNGNVYLVTGRVQMYSLEDMERLQVGEPLSPSIVSEVIAEDNKIYRLVDDEKCELIPVSRYESTDLTKLII